MRARRRTANAPVDDVRPKVTGSGRAPDDTVLDRCGVGVFRCWCLVRTAVRWLNAALIVWGRTVACVQWQESAAGGGPKRSFQERWLRQEAARGLLDIQRYLAHRERRA